MNLDTHYPVAERTVWDDRHDLHDQIIPASVLKEIKLEFPDLWESASATLENCDSKDTKSLTRVTRYDCLYSAAIETLREHGESTSETSVFTIEPSRLLKGVQALADSGRTQKAIVTVYDRVGDLCVDGRFTDCDELLANASVYEMDADLLLSLYLATARCKAMLKTRESFREAMTCRLEELLGKPEADEILASVK